MSEQIAKILDDSLKHKTKVYKELETSGWCNNDNCDKQNGCLDCFRLWQMKQLAALIASHEAPLIEVLRKVVAWNKKYPTSRIYNEATIKEIASEMDEICKDAQQALAKEGGK